YTLTVTFKLGTDSDMAQVLVQNRVSLALPVIPALVQNEGISVKKMSPNTLMIVNLVSPDGRYDDLFLSNYATIDVRDELGRLPPEPRPRPATRRWRCRRPPTPTGRRRRRALSGCATWSPGTSRAGRRSSAGPSSTTSRAPSTGSRRSP